MALRLFDNDSFWNLGVHPLHVEALTFKNMPDTPQLGIDLTEKEDKFVVHADLPGFKEEDVDVNIKDGVLTLSGKREKTVESKNDVSHRVERSFGEVRRSIRLPKGADQNNAQASLENGVLTIDLPKLSIEDVCGKRIPINTPDRTSKKLKSK